MNVPTPGKAKHVCKDGEVRGWRCCAELSGVGRWRPTGISRVECYTATRKAEAPIFSMLV